jgi:hypothetical protein
MCIQGFGVENLLERDTLEDPDLDGRIILDTFSGSWM